MLAYLRLTVHDGELTLGTKRVALPPRCVARASIVRSLNNTDAL